MELASRRQTPSPPPVQLAEPPPPVVVVVVVVVEPVKPAVPQPMETAMAAQQIEIETAMNRERTCMSILVMVHRNVNIRAGLRLRLL